MASSASVSRGLLRHGDVLLSPGISHLESGMRARTEAETYTAQVNVLIAGMKREVCLAEGMMKHDTEIRGVVEQLTLQVTSMTEALEKISDPSLARVAEMKLALLMEALRLHMMQLRDSGDGIKSRFGTGADLKAGERGA